MQVRTWSDKWYKNLVAFSIGNPLKTWWKARKYFSFPDIGIYFTVEKYRFPYASKHWQGKLLDISIHDVVWKDKWNSPRHERNPLIYICFLGKFALWITFGKYKINEFGEKEDGSMYYWEYMLDYLYYTKSLKPTSCWTYSSKIYRESTFKDDKKEYKPYSIVIMEHLFSLNKRGLKEFRKLYK